MTVVVSLPACGQVTVGRRVAKTKVLGIIVEILLILLTYLPSSYHHHPSRETYIHFTEEIIREDANEDDMPSKKDITDHVTCHPSIHSFTSIYPLIYSSTHSSIHESIIFSIHSIIHPSIYPRSY